MFAKLKERLAADMELARRRGEGFVLPLLFPHVFAIAMHRVAHAAWELKRPIVARLLWIVAQMLTGADIDYGANLGPGVYLVHPVGVVIGPETTSGRNLVLLGGVTLGGIFGGTRSRPESGYPTLGDDVEIYTNASVIGPVFVGDGAVIGAHALVLHDVPAGAVARGAPARSYIDGVAIAAAQVTPATPQEAGPAD